MLTMAPLPCWTICCPAAWLSKNTALRQTASTWSQCASLASRSGSRNQTAALFTRTSSRPKRSTARGTSARTSSARARSATTGRLAAPSPASSSASPCAAVASHGAWCTTTLAPARARPRQIACPMPPAAPVTSATRPASSRRAPTSVDAAHILGALHGVGLQAHHVPPEPPELPQPVVVPADAGRRVRAAGDDARARAARAQAALLQLHDPLVLGLLARQPGLEAALAEGALLRRVPRQPEHSHLVACLVARQRHLREDLRDVAPHHDDHVGEDVDEPALAGLEAWEGKARRIAPRGLVHGLGPQPELLKGMARLEEG